MSEVTYLEAIRQAMWEEMERDPRVILLGEDVGLYGGAFKVTAGFLEKFGRDRVIDTPISEEGYTGVAIGAAQTNLQASEDMLVSALADNGAVQLRIEVQQAQQQSRGDNLVALVQSETAADLPDSIVRLNQAQTAYQAALQSAANIMRISLLDYIK